MRIEKGEVNDFLSNRSYYFHSLIRKLDYSNVLVNSPLPPSLSTTLIPFSTKISFFFYLLFIFNMIGSSFHHHSSHENVDDDSSFSFLISSIFFF